MMIDSLTEAAPGVFLGIDVIDEASNVELVSYLDGVPEVPYEGFDRTSSFAFTRPVFDGTSLRGRAEACAGDPVWLDRTMPGTRIPAPLEELRHALNAHLPNALAAVSRVTERWRPLTSVYVDRYDSHGHFVAHTDRSIYGPFIVGVTVGDGFGDLIFEDGTGEVHPVRLTSCSMYLMGPPLRYDPWQHRFQLLAGTRYAITFRSAADHPNR